MTSRFRWELICLLLSFCDDLDGRGLVGGRAYTGAKTRCGGRLT